MSKPLRTRDFSRPKLLSPAFFRATNPHLNGAEFALKWKTALLSPLRFFRSFAQAWQVDLLDVPVERFPYARCWCIGDAHVENFGIVTFREGPAFVCNDLDDSGPGNPAIDALRYFTSLGLAGVQKSTQDALLEQYIEQLQQTEDPIPPPKKLWPSLTAENNEELNRWCSGDTFRFSAPELQLTAVEPQAENAIVKVLRKSITQEQYHVNAVARRQRDGGGSGGLERFLVLAKDDSGTADLLEFKETTRAATAWANQLREPEDRLERSMKEIWPHLTPRCYREVVVGRRRFLLRSRFGRGKLQFDEYKRKERDVILCAQVALLARQHREALKSARAKELHEWIAESSMVVSERWNALYAIAKAAGPEGSR